MLIENQFYHFSIYLIDAQNLEIGDISARISLIEDLKCRSFQWFIDNVYPDASFPNRHQYFGQVIILIDIAKISNNFKAFSQSLHI